MPASTFGAAPWCLPVFRHIEFSLRNSSSASSKNQPASKITQPLGNYTDSETPVRPRVRRRTCTCYRTVRIAHVWGCRRFTDFLSARNMSLNFFGTDCAQVSNFPSCPNVLNTHGSVGSTYVQQTCTHADTRRGRQLGSRHRRGSAVSGERSVTGGRKALLRALDSSEWRRGVSWKCLHVPPALLCRMAG
eukprot:COSAG02_NODE_3017_length_7545_cov_4.558286_2_plen_190_part_00